MIWTKKSFFREKSKTRQANKTIRRNKKGDVRNTAFKLQIKNHYSRFLRKLPRGPLPGRLSSRG